MIPMFCGVLTPQIDLTTLPAQPPDPIVLMRDAFLSVLQQFGVGRKFAQAEMRYSTRQQFDDAINKRSFSVYRLSLLPAEIKRVLWLKFKPFFGYESAEADTTKLEERMDELADENARLARELEDQKQRFDALEKIVKRVLPTEEPAR